jgi:hypothetical protein
MSATFPGYTSVDPQLARRTADRESAVPPVRVRGHPVRARPFRSVRPGEHLDRHPPSCGIMAIIDTLFEQDALAALTKAHRTRRDKSR